MAYIFQPLGKLVKHLHIFRMAGTLVFNADNPCDMVSDIYVFLIGIIVENPDSVSQINDILHEVRDYVVGRMGIPYRSRKLGIISVVLDAPEPVISSLAGKLGMLPGVSVKTVYSKKNSAAVEK